VFLLTKNASYYYDAAAIAEPAAYDGRHDTLMKGSTKYKVSVVPGQVEHTMAANGHERWQMNDDGERIRNKRTVWTIPTQPSTAAHFAVMPEALVAPCILAGCPEGGTVLDSFFGAGTVGLVAQRLGRHWLGSELNPTYVELATARIQGDFEQYQAREAGLPFTPRLFE
jgi:hypothetical protein